MDWYAKLTPEDQIREDLAMEGSRWVATVKNTPICIQNALRDAEKTYDDITYFVNSEGMVEIFGRKKNG